MPSTWETYLEDNPHNTKNCFTIVYIMNIEIFRLHKHEKASKITYRNLQQDELIFHVINAFLIYFSITRERLMISTWGTPKTQSIKLLISCDT